MKNTVSANDCSCPSCGAGMRYKPEIKKLYCDNCKTSKDIKIESVVEKHDFSDIEKHNKQTKEWQSLTKNLKCPNCGASVIINKLQYSSMCPYCTSNLVSKDDSDNAIVPDGIIPFTFSDEEASKKYVEGLKKKWFLPNKFKKCPPVDCIYGIYTPIFGYDSDTFGTYKGRLEIDHTDSDGDTHTTYRSISGDFKSAQRDVLVETSSKINQAQFAKILPYNMQKSVKFNQGFIMGYTVEHYQNTVQECKKVAEEIMVENIKKEILSKYHYDRVSYLNILVNHSNQKYMYYLVPIYKCDYKFKNKTYTTIMNGQTGKVGGGYPRSGVKIFFFVLMWILIIAGIFVVNVLTQGD